MKLAAWRKHPTTGAWLVYAPGAESGETVCVVANSGKAKHVTLHGEPVALAPGINCFPEFLVVASSVPLPDLPEPSHPLFNLLTKVKADATFGPSPVKTHKKIPVGIGQLVTKAKPLSTLKVAIHAPKPVTAPKPLARTQKARGVRALAQAGWQVPSHGIVDAALPLQHVGLLPMPLPAFVRPCPMTPQHGFVDSRVIETGEQLEALRLETTKADPQGELLMMPFLDGTWSAIVTPAALAIGPGHDAATAGHGAATSILLTDAKFEAGLLQLAGVSPDGMPYCELVEHGGKTAVVQLRSGPVVPRAKNYIPHKVPVVHVIDARPYTDLLDWQRIAKKLDPTCTVVIAADLTCHQAAHCTGHGIAVVTDGRELAPGMILKPEPMPPPDVQGFWEGLHFGLPDPIAGMEQGSAYSLRLALLALHQKTFMLQTAPGARLAGVALRTAVGIASAACHGEARHKLEHGLSRHQLFVERYPDAESDVHFLEEVFLRPIWGGSYGGKKWANCTTATVALRDAVRGCLQEPSQDAVTACFDALNMVVNVSHNGGLFLTKFGSTSNFDGAAQASAQWIAQRAVPAVWEALTKSVALPMYKPRKCLRSEDPKHKPKVPRTYQARARWTGHSLRLQVLLGAHKGHAERDFLGTPAIEKAWAACADNAMLASLVGSAAKYVPGFIRGNVLYLKPKSGWYVSTGLELPSELCPPTKKAKKALGG